MELPATFNALALLLLLLQLLARVQPRPQHYYASRLPTYYVHTAGPHQRRLEQIPQPLPVVAPAAAAAPAPAAVPAPAQLYQQQTPNFQVLNYRPSYQAIAAQQQQQQQLPLSYAAPGLEYSLRAMTPQTQLAKYRYEGNYMQRLPQRRAEESGGYNVPPALFTSNVLHVVPRSARQQLQDLERPRRYTMSDDALATASNPPVQEARYYHDIFMRFAEPHSRAHGHVLQHPGEQAQRYESQQGNNRYRGEVIWTDRQGAHGEHRWNLAQGKL